MLIRSLLIALVALLFAVPTHAGFGAFGRSLVKKAGKNNIPGDMADLKGKAKVRILPGYTFLGEHELAQFETELGNVTTKDEAGIMVPELGDWYICFTVSTTDPLAGQDKANINADALLNAIRHDQAEYNKLRRSHGLPEMRVVGWTHAPTYDSATNRLTFGIRITDDDPEDASEGINYFTYIYGPDNTIVEAMYVGEPKGYAKSLVEYKKVVENISFGGVGSWGGLSGLADNEKALLIGGGVMVVIVGIGLTLNRRRPERRRAPTPARPW